MALKEACKPAVFLDKDGTIIRNVPYNKDPNLIHLEKGVEEGLTLLSRAPFEFVVISNQPAIAFGKMIEEEVVSLFDCLKQKLKQRCGVELNGFYFCPHHPDGTVTAYTHHCDCRKPADGLIRRAESELDLGLNRSWLIGDILDDVEAGNRAGCRTVLIDNGNETEWKIDKMRKPDFIVKDFYGACETIFLEMMLDKIDVKKDKPE